MVKGAEGKREYLTLEEVKREELLMLLKFQRFCNEHSLRFSLAGGTLLGAVRHGGFIPWDDDIDLCMPRPDWDRLIALSDEYEVETGEVIGSYPGSNLENTPFIKVLSKEIMVHAEKEYESTMLWLDVFPVDGLPDEECAIEKAYSRADSVRSLVMAASSTAASGRNAARRLAKTVLCPVLRVPAIRSLLCGRLDAHARSVAYGTTKTVGAVTWGLYGAGEAMPLEAFEDQATVEFEGHKLPCMSCWHAYLTGIYGDYMKLPPEDKRVAHGMKAWRVDGGVR